LKYLLVFVISQPLIANLPPLTIAVKDITFFKNDVRLIKTFRQNFEDDAKNHFAQ